MTLQTEKTTDAEKIPTKEFSEATGIPRQTIDRWRNAGKIVGTNLSGKWFYNKDQIEVAKSIRAQNLKSQTDLQKSDTTASLPQLIADESEADTTAAQTSTVSIDNGSIGIGIDGDGDLVATPSKPTVETKTLSQRAERIRQLTADVQRGIIEIGFELIAAKRDVSYGDWENWLQTEFEWTDRTARNFMAVAQRFGKTENVFRFKPSTLIKMLALPTGEEADFIAAQAECGNPVESQSAREVQNNIRDWMQQKEAESFPCKIQSLVVMPTLDDAGTESAQKKKPPIYHSSGNFEWYTPLKYIDAARRALDGVIDLDPASCVFANQTVKAKKFFSAADDGLNQEWHGRIWLNPPYASGLIDRFVDKLLASDFVAAIVLVDNATETRWFKKLAKQATAICFTDHRIGFVRPDGSCKGHHTCGSAFFYFGDATEKFISAFQPFGWFTQSYQIGAMNHE